MQHAALRSSTIAVLALAAIAAPAANAASSTFNSNAEGWSALGDIAGPLTWSGSGGNPAGNVSIVDSVTGGVTYFVAPAAFLGNQSAALGTSLTFDLKQVFPGAADQFDSPDVILVGGGVTVTFDLPTNPANGSWTSYAVPLTAAAWHLNSLAGAAPTAAQFLTALSGLTALEIRAEYQTGSDTGSLDNVFLTSTAPIPEPETYALMLLGFGALAAATRRRVARSRRRC
jgi:hypothetical protein